MALLRCTTIPPDGFHAIPPHAPTVVVHRAEGGLLRLSTCSAAGEVFDGANFLLPFRPRGLESGQGAFTDQLPLEVGQRHEDAEHEAAGHPRPSGLAVK